MYFTMHIIFISYVSRRKLNIASTIVKSLLLTIKRSTLLHTLLTKGTKTTSQVLKWPDMFESQRIFICHMPSWAPFHLIIFLHLWLRQNQRGLRYCLSASFPLCSSEYYQAEIRCSSSPLLRCNAFTKLWNLLVRVLAIWNLLCAWIRLALSHNITLKHIYTYTLLVSHANPPRENRKLQSRPECVWMWHVSQLPRSPELDEGWLVGGRGVKPQAMSSPPCVSCSHSFFFFSYSFLLHFAHS